MASSSRDLSGDQKGIKAFIDKFDVSDSSVSVSQYILIPVQAEMLLLYLHAILQD